MIIEGIISDVGIFYDQNTLLVIILHSLLNHSENYAFNAIKTCAFPYHNRIADIYWHLN